MKLTEFSLAPELLRIIISYDKFERKGDGLVYDGAKQVLARCSNNEVVFDMSMVNNILYVNTVRSIRTVRTPSEVLMAILTHASTEESVMDKHIGLLYHFHQRLGHLSYEKVERMARNPESGITLTDH